MCRIACTRQIDQANLARDKAVIQPTHIKVVRFEQLSQDENAKWEVLRATQPEFATPFFSLRFVAAVHASRKDVLVAVLRCGDDVVGFFPFHRVGRVAFPVGRYFNDAHNVITSSTTEFDWMWLLQECDVKAFDFHALVTGATNHLAKYCQGTVESFSAMVGSDSQDFLRRLEQEHRTIRRQSQKSRKMIREVGPLTLELDCRDRELLDQNIRWKREQYRRTNILDLFTPAWTQELLHNLHGESPGGARGLLSVLRAGDRVVASHFGMIEGDMLHYWFPCYDPSLGKYSPGTALFTEIVRQASQHGIRCIDMGYGEQPYKRKQTDKTTTVSYGCVSRSILYRRWRTISYAAGGILKKVPLKEPLKKALRKIQPNAGISKLD